MKKLLLLLVMFLLIVNNFIYALEEFNVEKVRKFEVKRKFSNVFVNRNSNLVYLKNSLNTKLSVYDKDLKFKKKFLKIGRGPGEITPGPNGRGKFYVDIYDNKIYIFDMYGQRIHIYNKNNVFKETNNINIKSKPINFIVKKDSELILNLLGMYKDRLFLNFNIKNQTIKPIKYNIEVDGGVIKKILYRNINFDYIHNKIYFGRTYKNEIGFININNNKIETKELPLLDKDIKIYTSRKKMKKSKAYIFDVEAINDNIFVLGCDMENLKNKSSYKIYLYKMNLNLDIMGYVKLPDDIVKISFLNNKIFYALSKDYLIKYRIK